MAFLAVLLAKLLDPIAFAIALLVVLLSRRKWIIPLAALVAAIIGETLLYAMQTTRQWGEGVPIAIAAGCVHASLVYAVRSRIGAKKPKPNDSTGSEGENPIESVAKHLEHLGYKLTAYGAGVALVEVQSGYSPAEAASHIALTTIALDIREAGLDLEKRLEYYEKGLGVLETLKAFRDGELVRRAQWQNDAGALMHVITMDQHQETWVQKILSDPVAGKDRLATSLR